MHLVPVEDLLGAFAVGDEIVADSVCFAGAVGELGLSGSEKAPSGTGKAVLRRVDGLACALGGEVSDEETDGSAGGLIRWRIRWGLVHPVEKITFAKDVECFLVERDLG